VIKVIWIRFTKNLSKIEYSSLLLINKQGIKVYNKKKANIIFETMNRLDTIFKFYHVQSSMVNV